MRSIASLVASLVTALVLSLSSLGSLGCAAGGVEDGGSSSEESSDAGSFQLWRSEDGEFRFHLAASDGQILLVSEGYASRIGAVNGILSVIANGVDPASFSVAQAASGYVLRLVAGNGQIVGVSGAYATRTSATDAITAIVRAVVSYLDRREAQATGARVDVVPGEAGTFRFHIVGQRGELALISEAYASKAAAYNGAFAVQDVGRGRLAYTVYQTAPDRFYFKVAASNHQVLAVSEPYTSRRGAEAAIDALIALLPSLTVL